MVVDNLYSATCNCCGSKSGFNNEAITDITFGKDVISQALRRIYNKFDVQGLILPELFNETLRLFNEATVNGLAERENFDYDKEFLRQLRTNNEVFSAFRTHRMQNDLAMQMIDAEGKLKPFEKWVEDTAEIREHYVQHWLSTEYDTAVIRAHQAADWRQFEAEEDVYPNVRWMPTTSPSPDIYHRQYWEVGLTLPINHPFWEIHRPGDRWNCKCSLRQTDDLPTYEQVGDFEPLPPVPGLDNNPAKDGKLFSDSHPYYTEAYPTARETVSNFLDKRKRD